MSSPVVSEVLPVELRLTAPPTMPQARSYMFKQKSDLQEYNVELGNCIKINIPRLQRSYLTKDSYVRFQFSIDFLTNDTTQDPNNTKAAGLWFDRIGALGLFDRLEVYDYLGGTLLERITDLPMLMTLLYDLENPMLAANGKYEAVGGFNGSGTSYLTEDLNGGSSIDGNEIKTASIGKVLVNPQSVPSNSSPLSVNITKEFCIPLVSFLGIFSDKFVPLHNGFTINLYTNNINNALVSRYASRMGIDPRTVTIYASWLSNVEICAQVIELGDIGESLVMSGNGGNPWIIPTKAYRTFKHQVKTGDSSFRLDMNLNVVSLRNIRFTMTPNLYFNNLQWPVYGNRIRNFLRSFNFQYGSSYLPELAGIAVRGTNVPNSRFGFNTDKPVDILFSSTQGYIELLKTCTDKWSNMRNECAITQTEYNTELCNYADANSNWERYTYAVDLIAPCYLMDECTSGKFAGGIDLRLNNKAIVSGIDTNGLLVCLNGQFDPNYITNITDAILYAHAEYDAFVQIIPGVATTVTF